MGDDLTREDRLPRPPLEEPLLAPARIAPARRGRELIFHLGVAVFFSLLALLFLRPPLGSLDTTIAGDLGDPVFNLYVLRWGSEHLGDPQAFWNAPFFHPTPDTTTLSDDLLGPATAAWLLERLGLHVVTAFNLLFLLAFVLAGWTASWVARRAGLGRAGALVAGICFTFAPYRWDQMAHFQILLVAFIPLVLWTFDRALVSRDGRSVAAFLAAYALHLSGSLYLALMIHPALLVILLHRLEELRGASPRQRRWLVLGLALAGSMLALVAWPFVMADPGFTTVRRPSAWRTYAATVTSYWTPPAPSLWFGQWTHRWVRPENSLFPGLSTLVLAGGWLWWRHHGWARRQVARLRADSSTAGAADHWHRWLLRGCLVLAAVGLLAGDLAVLGSAGKFSGRLPPKPFTTATVLLLAGILCWLVLRRRYRGSWHRALPGPSLWLPPWERSLLVVGLVCLALGHVAVYDPLGHFVPGFDRIRVPARFFTVTSFALAFFAGRGADALAARIGDRWRLRPLSSRVATALASIALVTLVAAELRPRPLPWSVLPEVGDAAGTYAWLAAQDDVEAIFELPCFRLTDDLRWMWQQPLHGKPLANGYSGHFPPYYQRLKDHGCWPTPDDEALELLRSLGVTHLVIHPAWEWPRRWMRRQVRAYGTGPGIEEVYAENQVRVFRLLPATEEPGPHSSGGLHEDG